VYQERTTLIPVHSKVEASGLQLSPFNHYGIIFNFYLSRSYKYLAEIKQYSGTHLLR